MTRPIYSKPPLPEGILEYLVQDVIQRLWDVGEAGIEMAVDTDLRSVAIFHFAHVSER